MSRFSVLRYTGRFKEKGDKLIPVLLDAAGQPENINGENKWCLFKIFKPHSENNYKIT